MKSITPKEFYYTIMLKSQLKKKISVHSHQLFLISINKKHGYIFFAQFNETSINIYINLKGNISGKIIQT